MAFSKIQRNEISHIFQHCGRGTYKLKVENQIRNEMHQLHATTLEEVILRIPAEKVRFNGINQLQRAQYGSLRCHLKKKITPLPTKI